MSDLGFDDFDDDAPVGDAGADGGTDEDGAGSDGVAPEESKETLRKMQSARDKETARANKLQKQLEEMQAKPSAKDETSFDTSAIPAEVREWLSASKDNVRQQLYDAEPRFAEYGFDPSLITGDTPKAMRASAKELSATVARMETVIRNSLLVEHGFDPAPVGEERTPSKSYKTMSKDEFDLEVRRALGEL